VILALLLMGVFSANCASYEKDIDHDVFCNKKEYFGCYLNYGGIGIYRWADKAAFYDGKVKDEVDANRLGYAGDDGVSGAVGAMNRLGLFGEDVRNANAFYWKIIPYEIFDNGYCGFVLRNVHFVITDPGAGENCTDGIDNDGDGFIDCEDIKCKGTPECKPKFNSQCVGCCGGDDAPDKGAKPLSSAIAKLLGRDFQSECCKDNQASGDSTQTSTPPPPTPCEKEDGEPVGVNSGYFTDSRVDISLPGRMLAAVVPYYHSQADFMGPLGHGWSSVLSVRLLKWADGSYSLRDMWGRREDFSSTGTNTSKRFYSEDLQMGPDTISIRLDRDHIFQFSSSDGALLAVRDDRGAAIRFGYETDPSIAGSQAVPNSVRYKYGIHGVSRYATPRGYRATVTQDMRVNTITDGDDATRKLTVTWDTSGMVGSITDPVGRKVSYQYDGKGNLTQVTFPDGTARRYRWTDTNDIHRLTAFDARAIRPSLLADTNILTRNEWDVLGRVTRQLHQGAEWKIERSSYNHGTSDNGNTRTHTWTRNAKVTRTEPDGLGGTRTTTRTFTDEVVNTQAIDGKPDGNTHWARRTETIAETVNGVTLTSVIRYNQDNSILSETRPDGTIVSNASNGLTQSVTEEPLVGPKRTTTVTLDATGHVTRQVVASSLGTSDVKTWDWSNGLLQQECRGEGIEALCSQRTYDASQRLINLTDPVGAVTTYVYNGTSQQPDSVRFSDGSGERYTRDGLGRIVAVKNSLGQVRTTSYDALGRDTLSCRYDGSCTRNVYDGPDLVRTEEGGQILSGVFAMPQRTRRFAVDGWGRRVKEWLVTPTRDVLKRKSVVDAFGNVVEVWDSPDSTADSANWRLVERNQYDGRNHLLSHKTFPANGAGLSTRYKYDALGHAVNDTDARGAVVKRIVDPWGNVLTETNAVGAITRHVYDQNNRVVTDTLPGLADGIVRIVTHRYDAQGNEVQRVGYRKDTTLWIYVKGRLTKERSPEGRWTTYGYDAMGRVTRIVKKVADTALVADTDDQMTEYGYDVLGRRVKETVAGTIQHRYGLDAAGRVVLDTNALGLVTKSVYDALGRAVQTTTPAGDNLFTDYDAQGRVFARRLNADTLSVTRYDDADRPVIERTPGKGAVVREYDGTDFVIQTTDSVGIVTTATQDKSGRDSTISVAGKVRTTVRDSAGRTIRQIDERGNAIKMAYDALDRLVKLTDADNNATVFTYTDSSNGWQRRRTAYPDAKVEDHVWDREGRLRRFVDGRGVAAEYRYDSLGQLAGIRYVNADGSVATDSVKLEYDALGRLANAVQGAASVSTTYDALGRPATSTQTVDGSSYVLGYAYDDAARKRTVTLPDGTTTTTAWTALGQVGSVLAGDRELANFVYTNGLENTRNLGNGIVAKSTWDAAGRPASVAYGINGVPLAGLSFGYDAAGNRNAITRDQTTLSEAMTYTPDNQLASWSRGTASQSWTLDSRGNWTNWTTNGTAQARTHTGANELTKTVTGAGASAVTSSVIWDAAGNLTSDGSLTYAWNARGLMATASNADGVVGGYTYDPLGRRSMKVAGGIKTISVFDGWQCVWQKVTSSGVDTVKSFTYGDYIDRPIAMIRKWGASSDSLWYLQGNNENVDCLTDRTGAIVERYEYTPYGKASVYSGNSTIAANVSARGNALTFQGRELDGETNLAYFRNRYYAPGMGTFTGRDPLRFGADAANLFRFDGSNPFVFSDPFGLKCSIVSKVAMSSDSIGKVSSKRIGYEYKTYRSAAISVVMNDNSGQNPPGLQKKKTSDLGGLCWEGKDGEWYYEVILYKVIGRVKKKCCEGCENTGNCKTTESIEEYTEERGRDTEYKYDFPKELKRKFSVFGIGGCRNSQELPLGMFYAN